MRICFVSHSSVKGGAERALLELIDALRMRDIEIYVLLPSYGPLVEELKNRNITYGVVSYKWWMGKNSPLWKRIGRIIVNFCMLIPVVVKLKRWSCDVVYTNTITVCIGAFAAKLLKLPHIWHIHEFGYEDHGLVFDLGQRLSLWFVDHLSNVCIVNSNAVAQKYRQYIKPLKVKVVYQSVTVQQDYGVETATLEIESETVRCMIVGTLQEGKRQEDAILAIGELAKQGVKAELYIVGDGDPKYKEYLHKLVRENRLDNKVKFIGYVENPWPLMQSVNVILMCSRYEAFGRVTVEGMKLGKPVIGARSGGTTELIQDGFNGFLYPPGDYKKLAEKIMWLYKHPELAKQIGENGQKWANTKFNQERYGDEILAILKQIFGNNKQKESGGKDEKSKWQS